MKTAFHSFLVLSALLAASACGAPSDQPSTGPANPEPVATSRQGLTLSQVGTGVSAAKGVVSAVQSLYSAITWLNCNVSQYCPETDAQAAADRVIQDVSAIVESIDDSGLEGRLIALSSEFQRDFSDPQALATAGSSGEEATLFDTAEQLFYDFATKLNSPFTDPTNQAEVDAAYALAPSFNILAAFLDNLSRIELVRQQAPITYDILNNYRATTLATNEALVGSQSLWYQCPGSASPTSANTTATWDNSFPTTKLWKEFSNYQFGIDSCSNNCNVSRGIAPVGQAAPWMCQHDCDIICFGVCGLVDNQGAFDHEIAKITTIMNRDPVVSAVRAATEALVGLSATRGSGLMWRQSTGELDLWNVWSDRSYEPFTLGVADLGWQTIGTGDFNGDGQGDILWQNGSFLSIWLVSGNSVTTMIPATSGPLASNVYIGDLDGDGISDLVWAFPPDPYLGYQSTTWFMNSGSTIPRSTSTFTSQTDIVQGVGNFDNDSSHQSDILYHSQTTGEVSIAFNGGPETPIGAASLDWQITGVGDFNGDQFSDILWYNVNSGDVAIWGMGLVNGSPAIVANVGVGSSPPSGGWTIQGVTDLDHDGISDLVWRQGGSGWTNYWMLSSPTGSVREVSEGVYVDPSSAFAGVINLGPPNVASAAANPPAPPVGFVPNGNTARDAVPIPYCGAASGTVRNAGFAEYEQWWGGTFDGGEGTLLGDVDGDGKADLVGLGDGYVGILPSTGSGFGAYATAWPGSFFGNYGTFLGDVDGDGKADLVGLGSGYIGVIRSTGWIGPGFNSFGNYETWGYSTFYGSAGTFLGDVNGDGKADLVGVGQGGIVEVALSTGSGFAAPQTWYVGPGEAPFGGEHGALLGDVNGDGNADLVFIYDDNLTVMTSTGTSFSPPNIWFDGSFFGSQNTMLGDVDGNGKADVIAIDAASVRVMRSEGSYFGTAAQTQGPYYEVWWARPWSGTHGVFVGDIDGNSRADLVAAGDGYIGAVRSQ